MQDYMLAIVSNTYVAKAVGHLTWTLVSIALNETGNLVKEYIWRNYVTELEVSSSDRCYQWLLEWIAIHNDQLLHFTVTTVSRDSNAILKFEYEPNAGQHVFKYKGQTIFLKRNRSSSVTSEYNTRPFETLNLSTWGRKKKLLNEILEEARLYALSKMELGTILIMVPSYETWQTFGEPRVPRSKSSVILDNGVFETILEDLQYFMKDQSWYTEKGIPYRRGYLLFGPPGCGKTSLIMVLAGEIKYNLCVLSLNNSQMSDDQLIKLMGEVPRNSLILLEDIDAMFTSRVQKSVIESSSKVTLSGLLNAIDGVMSSECRIVFMTTNYVDRVDSALIRAGRVDFKQYLGPCSNYQLSKMFTRFRPEGTDNDVKRFMDVIRSQNKPVIPAHLQEFFLMHRHKELNSMFEHIDDLWQDVQNIQLTE
ncbi:ATPase, AAA-type, core,ATPase, AAA-type, conserved site,P-loop containing nucleoside triphosphate [Cinara cedri]|uniref:Mitochondrial chaperone BCS1 n=1 Tax=Cinara cedri TaxID=506608 RepID=A0A5E4M5W5_9HEMI|nr:ATPase, AAA-type, core,ATPase, AAA-type, conserved site,P-loop containing nucleoside triphosphate [Cinara cedri]